MAEMQQQSGPRVLQDCHTTHGRDAQLPKDLSDNNKNKGCSGGDASGTEPAAIRQQALDRALHKVSWVVLPQLFLASATNYLDRTALSFASLQMNADLQLSTQQYGLAAATFALGYGIGHIPSTYLGMKFGIHRWFAFITTAWGVVAMFAAMVHNAPGLYWQRAVLGLAEAGAVPCAVHLLAQFFPRSRLTKPMTVVTLGMTLSTIIAPPLAAGLMSINAAGLRGWQWLFILEGAPSVLLGVVMVFALPSKPLHGNAWMLTAVEQELVESEVHGLLAAGPSKPQAAPSLKELLKLMLEALQKAIMWYLTLAGFLVAGLLQIFTLIMLLMRAAAMAASIVFAPSFTNPIGNTAACASCVRLRLVIPVNSSVGLNAFMPIIIKNMLAGTAAAGSTSTGGNSALNTRNAMLLSAIPYTMAAIAMSVTAWHSDRVRERTLHIGVTAMVGSVFWLCFGPMYNRSLAAGFVSLVFTLALAYAQMGVMYARVTEQLDARHAGIGVSIFNAIGAAFGGFIGPYVTGAVVQRMGSFVEATLIQGSFLLASGTLMTSLGLWEQLQKLKTRRLLGSNGAGNGST